MSEIKKVTREGFKGALEMAFGKARNIGLMVDFNLQGGRNA